MRFTFVGYHPPEPEGSAAGRQLFAVGEALRSEGHDVSAWCWREQPPARSLPQWCEWRPVPTASTAAVRSRALLRPRSDIVRAGWLPPDDGVVVADDPASFAAVLPAGRRAVATVHYAVRLDRAALGDWSAPEVQDWRAERHAVRRAGQVWTLSGRVRDHVGRGVVVPGCVPVPEQPLAPVEEPVALLLANWDWAPNLRAADVLLRGWPQVRAAVPGARLVLAGRGRCPVGEVPGVEWRGEVASTTDALAEAAVFAFPCPSTSGPKMKVLDALGHGVPVVTTLAGVEGFTGGGAVVAERVDLVAELTSLLSDPSRRSELSQQARASVVAGHSPQVAARARAEQAARLLAAGGG